MTSNSTKSPTVQSEAETAVRLLDDWFDPIEAGLRGRVREFIQTMIEAELEHRDAERALSRPVVRQRAVALRHDRDRDANLQRLLVRRVCQSIRGVRNTGRAMRLRPGQQQVGDDRVINETDQASTPPSEGPIFRHGHAR
jgi:hypothetical protein